MTMSTYAALGKGGGVLDKPIIEKTTPGRESEFDLRYTFICLALQDHLQNAKAHCVIFTLLWFVQEIKEDGSTIQGDTTQRQLQQEGICGSGVDEGHTRHDC